MRTFAFPCNTLTGGALGATEGAVVGILGAVGLVAGGAISGGELVLTGYLTVS